jgi:hypothetical protein
MSLVQTAYGPSISQIVMGRVGDLLIHAEIISATAS